ncbi:MAG: hypothetical protein ACTSWC_02245 [Promethearchaeota archaeon]
MKDIEDKSIITLIDQFSHNQRVYFLFSLKGNSHDFLYLTHFTQPITALFFGTGFAEFLKDFDCNASECLECELGTRILGGVSIDHDSQVEFNLSKKDANKILVALKDAVATEFHQYFKEFS